MELLRKLEHQFLGWFKNVPHLPAGGQKWLGDNVWWIVLIGVIISGLVAFFGFFGLLAAIALLSAPSSFYYVDSSITSLAVLTTAVALVYTVVVTVLMALAIKPLKEKQKKGWVLLFAAWLIQLTYVVVSAVLTLNVFGFLISLIFGALFAAIGAYFLFEIHGQFDKKAKVIAAKKSDK